MHPATLPYLYRLRQTQWWSPAELERRQWQKLRRLLHHAYERVPYYRQLFGSAGITPADIRSQADLSLIPVTTKEMLQQVPQEELFATGVKPAHCIERRTSGTTGQPLAVFLSPKQKEAQDMVQARALLENGLKLTDRRAVFVAPWQIPRRQYAFQRLRIWRKTYFSVFDDIRQHMPLLERLAPDSIAATPAILQLIGLETLRRGSEHLTPRTLFSTADLLDRSTRELLDTVFGVQVVDHYGCLEVGYMAWQCSERRGYHMNMESVVMEFLQHGQCAPRGEAGEVVCTSLLAYAMPLIRYRLGDLCVPSQESCPCGRGLPLIQVLEGRTNDVFHLPGGRAVTPQALADAMVACGEMIQQFRIVQEDEPTISVYIVKGRGYTAGAGPVIEHGLQQVLGRDVTITIHVVASIARDPSGKRRAIISHVSGR